MPRFLVGNDIRIIDVARWLFGAMGATFLSLGIWMSRKKGYPLLTFPKAPPAASAPRPRGLRKKKAPAPPPAAAR
jgi:hypothetical protein